MTENNGGPAFPVQDASKWQAHGMTLRDYFAAMAMQGLVGMDIDDNATARDAYKMADAMLKAREA